MNGSDIRHSRWIQRKMPRAALIFTLLITLTLSSSVNGESTIKKEINENMHPTLASSRRRRRMLNTDNSTTSLSSQDSDSSSTSRHSSNIEMSYQSKRRTLGTTFDAISGSYGNMFDVRALKHIVIEGLDVHTDLHSNITYELYTKKGSYLSSKDLLDDWALVANGTVSGRGLGKGTPLLQDNFEPVPMTAGDIRGFYVTLTTFDIRYSPGTAVGRVYKGNADLEVLEGSGVARYPLGNLFYAPRIWNGNVHYRNSPTPAPSAVPTETMEPSVFVPEMTTVIYPFAIQFPSVLSVSDIELGIDNSVHEALLDIINDYEEPLSSLAANHRLGIDSVLTIVAEPSGSDNCTASDIGFLCSDIDIRVNVNHDNSITPSEVNTFLHQYYDRLMKGVDLYMNYTGPTVASTGMLFSLEVDKNDAVTELGSQSKEFFASLARQMLNDDLSRSENPIQITSVVIDFQGHLDVDNSRRILKSVNQLDTLDIHATITGEYQPPPEVNLGVVVEESIDASIENFVTQLNESPDFEMKVAGAKVKEVALAVDVPIPLNDTIVSPVSSDEPLVSLVYIAIAFVLLVVLFAGWTVVKRHSRNMKLRLREEVFKNDMFDY